MLLNNGENADCDWNIGEDRERLALSAPGFTRQFEAFPTVECRGRSRRRPRKRYLFSLTDCMPVWEWDDGERVVPVEGLRA
jgi:hypothetical protein